MKIQSYGSKTGLGLCCAKYIAVVVYIKTPMHIFVAMHANLRMSYFCACFSDDCAVIDEIQMIAESERGFAWTKALLGNMYKNENIYTTSLWSDLFWMKEC